MGSLERTAAAVYFTCGRASHVRRRGRSTALRYLAGVARMDEGPPELIAIEHDDYAAKYVGRTGDGGQFILTTRKAS